jgi:hypothetical protein
MEGELERYRFDFNKEILANKIIEVLKEKPNIDFEKYLQKFKPSSVVARLQDVYSL